VKSANSERFRFFLYPLQDLSSNSPTTKLGKNKELVQESVRPPKLDGVPATERNVSDQSARAENQPDRSQVVVFQQAKQCNFTLVIGPLEALELMVCADQGYETSQIFSGG
jgi:hypothetical protein